MDHYFKAIIQIKLQVKAQNLSMSFPTMKNNTVAYVNCIYYE